MSNMFFCKENTKIIEVTCGVKWVFFNVISKTLNLKHIQCQENKLNKVIELINKHPV